jgi:hypothetical protein
MHKHSLRKLCKLRCVATVYEAVDDSQMDREMAMGVFRRENYATDENLGAPDLTLTVPTTAQPRQSTPQYVLAVDALIGCRWHQ